MATCMKTAIPPPAASIRAAVVGRRTAASGPDRCSTRRRSSYFILRLAKARKANNAIPGNRRRIVDAGLRCDGEQ